MELTGWQVGPQLESQPHSPGLLGDTSKLEVLTVVVGEEGDRYDSSSRNSENVGKAA